MGKASCCTGYTKAGKPCRAAATEGGLCYFHANPNKAAELGRIGGKRNARQPGEAESVPLPVLDTAVAVRDTVDRLASELYSGSLSPAKARVLIDAMHLQLRAIDAVNTEDLKKRVAALEEWRRNESELREVARGGQTLPAEQGHSGEETKQ